MASQEQAPVSPSQYPEVTIEFDDAEESDYASTYGTDTTSLTSSVFNYTYENGRRYASQRKGSGEYIMPNDEEEQERLDLLHHLILGITGGDLHNAPLKNPKTALDIGTGTGIWAIDFADQYPECQVIGTDLSPVQPTWVPPNVKFEIDDFEQEWVFGKKFDYIHARYLMGGVKDWSVLLKKAFDHLNPGGYVEILEGDVTGGYSEDGTFEGSPVDQYTKELHKAALALGTSLAEAPKLAGYLTNIGYTNVTQKVYKSAIGTWPKDPVIKESGRIGMIVASEGVDAYGLALLTRGLGWSIEKAKEFCAKAGEGYKNRKIHTIYPLYTVYAQKPLET
ncbi:S-adenosyl-L-methionine-dependent methyltransferase [Ascobolus immersus RN42]|uniref:S-adenosyl-L-methionine-dependent methyltransferase n=1 Tax=Ascobolus immersus RN42 TaxID=1160509 RepID=A0A3N4I9X9_ASCIM|nr:S-adenosyl-L-methionine-dependent methyltransferase [Ascobolus immersus RN42]